MPHDLPSFKEDHISQVPALQLLQHLGYRYLTEDEAVTLRGGRLSSVLLDGVVEEQLRKINKIRYKGDELEFSEGNIQSAVQALKELPFDGLVRTNEKIYELLLWGKSLQQSIRGDTKSFPLQYIDWNDLSNNLFHVTEEFVVERSGSHDTCRPDIVLFVNGIPLCVIECKRPDMKDPIDQAISQQLRNQRDDHIPKLFLYSQLLMAISKNEAKYATTGTPLKFWAVWKERMNIDSDLSKLINQPLAPEEKDRLFAGRFRYVRDYFDGIKRDGREITEQDRALYCLCRPERLLELMQRFILFDAGEKKVARYQQYFTVRTILDRIGGVRTDGRRLGGVVWHTQGSGKSLTMVMLANAIATDPAINDYKVVLVTDRVDLDDQIYKTFRHCGTEPVQAKTGKHLAELIASHKSRIITTVIDKFDAAVGKHAVRNENPNIFALVDEGHRGQYGEMHAKMRNVLPNACFIAFTGTPVMKKEKHTIDRFGGLIEPAYTIRQAVEDKAVVPLLYEGRHVEQKVESESIDDWFERLTDRLSKEQCADLKKKFTTTDQLNKAQQKVMRVAWDISVHYRDNWQGTPYKAQLVTQDKSTALLYKKFLDEFGMVTSEVLISGPDMREGNEEVEETNPEGVQAFWKKMMTRFGNETTYNKQIINAFKHADEPEIIIVVDKLLTGFDAPRNTVLYLTRKLKDHTLLQAIARVNRLCEGKEFGYIIDYRGVLQELDSALDLYSSLPEFAKEDLAGTLTDVSAVIRKLPEKHSQLWDLFKSLRNKKDEEAYERLLADEEVRTQFYERLSAYSRCLAIALASAKFLEEAPASKIDKYKADLKFFMKLRTSVRKRYAEAIDFKEYEPKIQKLVDTYIGTGEVEKITDLVNIFDADAFAEEVEKLEGTASKADTIAFRTKRTIEERMQEDPAFYRRFSEMLEDAIRAFREQRLSDAEYLRQVSEISESVRTRTGDELPERLRGRKVAQAFYGVAREVFSRYADNGVDPQVIGAEAGAEIDDIIQRRRIVNWTTNPDVQNQMKTDIEDYLFELKEEHGFDLTFEDMDSIMEQCLEIARLRYAS
ncbi:MAG: type I restriction endonuclease subunit R [Planctomycetota bacterium]|nr:MAG: type I restriction endonuclease subunit R [Planctomycetota bacterium]REK28037.1 MAG: type I restriction endonuclease subunit R [Planctomycetota bacterium]REK37564.1 MAG: type I restriction endonuclease subunit R [Planctomycetota bacterium]